MYIFTKRVTTFRRMLCKHPEIDPIVNEIMLEYTKYKHVCTFWNGIDISQLTIAPPAGAPNRSCWQPKVALAGPIGLLLQDLHYKAMVMDTTLTLKCCNETDISIRKCPWQYLKRLAYQMANRSRTAQACFSRTVLEQTGEIDFGSIQKAAKKLDIDEQRQIKYLQSLGDWNQSKLEKYGLDLGKCPCGLNALDLPNLEPNMRTYLFFLKPGYHNVCYKDLCRHYP